MRLATSPLTIAHGSDAVRLRPSLRAAHLLYQAHGFGRLVEGIQITTISTILDMIDAGTDFDPLGHQIVERTIDEHGVIGLSAFSEALFRFVAETFGVDETEEHPAERDKRTTGKPFDMGKALDNLFEIGTGWLGWTPETTWTATPAEIITAHRGLIAKLSAIHGSADDEGQPGPHDDGEISPEQLRENIARLKELAGGAS
ncbi:hypothetical protein [Pararhizobium mangrovi]|uniref:Tail assembly chaperone n=1 Tax=Pararhizobium mangrovi TaxID=2590452 RepID=A0A506U087_9HYPH|nr:hypothetical protein [Pararhizobium mangrovi]TPW26385.1 hypothetical protein FJU11_15020 [Pararhizobium mangrovi]